MNIVVKELRWRYRCILGWADRWEDSKLQRVVVTSNELCLTSYGPDLNLYFPEIDRFLCTRMNPVMVQTVRFRGKTYSGFRFNPVDEYAQMILAAAVTSHPPPYEYFAIPVFIIDHPEPMSKSDQTAFREFSESVMIMYELAERND